MEVIIDAKERQAAEANKNATILLQEIDQEKVSSTVHRWFLGSTCTLVCIITGLCGPIIHELHVHVHGKYE